MRTTKILLFVFTLSFLYSVTAVAENEERNVSPFSAISLNVSGTVYLEQGSPQSVRVEASESVLEDLITEVKDRTLVIRIKNNNFFWPSFNTGKVEVYITVPDIEALTVSGSGNIESRRIKSQNLNFTVSGSGDISIENLDSEHVKASVSGSGNIHLNGGSTDEMNVSISGSGKVKAMELEAANVNASISGSGNFDITARETLRARVSGSGNVGYKGSPQVDSTVSGSGKVKKL